MAQKKLYTIPITYRSVTEISVEAETLQEATTEALKAFFAIPDDKYLSDSYEVDKIVEDTYGEKLDYLKLENDL